MNEIAIRSLLIERINEGNPEPRPRFISELFFDQFNRRADLVVVGQNLCAFEIKSQRDTLNRLDGQISSYAKYFEEVTVVCAPNHLNAVQALATSTIGIWLISSTGQFSVVREAAPSNTPSTHNWLSFLPVAQLRALLKAHGHRTKGNRSQLVEVALQIPRELIRTHVLNSLSQWELRIEKIRTAKANQIAVPAAGSNQLITNPLNNLIQSIATPVRAIPRARIPTQSNHHGHAKPDQ